MFIANIKFVKINVLSKSNQRAQTLPRPLHCHPMVIYSVSDKAALQRRPLVNDNIMVKKFVSPSIKERKKNWCDIHMRTRINTKIYSLLEGHIFPLPCPYHVWSTSVSAWCILLTDRMTDRMITLLRQPWRSYNSLITRHRSVAFSVVTLTFIQAFKLFGCKPFRILISSQYFAWKRNIQL